MKLEVEQTLESQYACLGSRHLLFLAKYHRYISFVQRFFLNQLCASCDPWCKLLIAKAHLQIWCRLFWFTWSPKHSRWAHQKAWVANYSAGKTLDCSIYKEQTYCSRSCLCLTSLGRHSLGWTNFVRWIGILWPCHFGRDDMWTDCIFSRSWWILRALGHQ